MAYVKDMGEAANRHYVDGKTLQDKNRHDGAGYHYGFAAECAIKQLLIKFGVAHDDSAIWAHFPALRELAMGAIQSRRASPAYNLLNQASFMQEWNTDMRYAKNASITFERAAKWRADADSALGLLI
jgi:hypothetical protein